MSQSITEWKAYEILRGIFPAVTEETVDILSRSGELEIYRVGMVDRTDLDDVQRVLRSWQEQAETHNTK